MSTRADQFLLWGICLPYSFAAEWDEKNGGDGFSEHFRTFIDGADADGEVRHEEGIICLFDGRDGRFIIIGRVIERAVGKMLGTRNPVGLKKFSDLEQELIRASVKRNFGVEGDFDYWLVTKLS